MQVIQFQLSHHHDFMDYLKCLVQHTSFCLFCNSKKQDWQELMELLQTLSPTLFNKDFTPLVLIKENTSSPELDCVLNPLSRLKKKKNQEINLY